jgi:glycosyltransferase involved in cell wall biosynthesis
LDGRFVIGFAGSLKGWHGLDTLLPAVAALPMALQPVLLMVGHGPERDSLADRAATLGVDARWVGAVRHSEVPGLLAAADVCVAGLPVEPEWQYFSPLKALEYMACGRPTVVAAAGDLLGLAHDGVALAYRPGDTADLIRQLLAVATHRDLAERLSKEGRSYAENRTWRAAARAIVQEVEALSPAAAIANRHSSSGAPRRSA